MCAYSGQTKHAESSMTITTRVTIARDSGVPLYRQLRQALEHEIATGALDPDLPLPSSRELARELGLSRNTVNTAYAELEAEGFVDAEPRRGLFVNKEMFEEATRSPNADVPKSVDWSRHLNVRPDADMPEIAKVGNWHLQPYPFVGGQIDPAVLPASGVVACAARGPGAAAPPLQPA